MNTNPVDDPYAKAGVNVALGDSFSSFCGRICKESYHNSQFVRVHDFSKGHFRGRRAFSFLNAPDGCLTTAGSDGIGSKVIVASSANMFGTSAHDLLAMVGGDFTRDGCFPLVLLNHLDVASLGKNTEDPAYQAACSLMSGLATAAKDQGYVLLGGETAELPDCVSSENPSSILKYNWGAVMIGLLHPDKLIRGDDVKLGDRIIALRDVTRSNGMSLLRKWLRHKYGDEWYYRSEALPSIEELAHPSALYDNFLSYMNGWTTSDFEPIVKMKLIAHLSGGGIKSKFAEDLLFPRGLSARLDNLWTPCDSMKECFSDLKVSDERAYEVWGCGQGELVVVPESMTLTFKNYAGAYGINARDAGCIVETPSGKSPSLQITSWFTGDKFSYIAS